MFHSVERAKKSKEIKDKFSPPPLGIKHCKENLLTHLEKHPIFWVGRRGGTKAKAKQRNKHNQTVLHLIISLSQENIFHSNR